MSRMPQKDTMIFACIILLVFIVIALIKLWFQDIPLFLKAIFTFISLPVGLFLTLIVYNQYK